MLSTQICVMALTLVGVTPGGFNADNDCNVVVNSSSAAMITSDACYTRRERQKDPAIVRTRRVCVEKSRDNKHELYSRSQINRLSGKV
jgi:hypothetical protein